ncbi:hypothetical protein HGRIS_006760 [Hohenbuehelia grisea]|uniref:DUF6534 domain-containing protein n=1 Tax=Hohenbuehelia grisea TaxID=104357 RepID=A0ABR3JA89_9AGAR
MADIHQVIDFPSTIGALEITILFSTGLTGILVVQMYLYYKNFVSDPLWIKLYVAVIGLFELGHLVAVGHDVYAVTVTGWGNPEALVRYVGISATPILASVVSTMVQLFFARRIWIMGQRKGAILCYILIAIRCVAAFATGCVGLTYHAIEPFLEDFEWLLTTYISIGVAIDILIPIFLCWLLRSVRDSGLKSTASLVDRIMVWTIQTGLTTGVVSLTSIIVMQTMKNFIWIGLYFNVTRLYANSLVMSLNTRAALRNESSSISIFTSGDFSRAVRGPSTKEIAIEMSRKIDIDTNETHESHKSNRLTDTTTTV